MDKIDKILRKLTTGERRLILVILKALQVGKINGLDIKKLKGREDIFRARKGNFRIIYRWDGINIFVLAIERRNEKTYKF